jgi:hypothetical protein
VYVYFLERHVIRRGDYSGGMLVFNIFGSLAQFERDLIRWIEAARERGNLGGRRPVITPDKLRKARVYIASA